MNSENIQKEEGADIQDQLDSPETRGSKPCSLQLEDLQQWNELEHWTDRFIKTPSDLQDDSYEIKLRHEAFDAEIAKRSKETRALHLTQDVLKRVSRNKARAIEKKKNFCARIAKKHVLSAGQMEMCKKNRLRAIEIKKAKAFLEKFHHLFE